MEPGEDVVSIRHSASTWLSRAGMAIKKFFGPFEPATAPGASSKHACALTCVWYGRAMFCLYLPEPFPPPGSPGQEVGEVPRVLDAKWIGRETVIATSLCPGPESTQIL